MIKKKLFIYLILLKGLIVSPSMVSAQTYSNNSFARYDSISYKSFLNGDWGNVISIGKDALKAGHDYYYLRMRLGYAYFYNSNYRHAATHFSKALQFNSFDTVAARFFNLSCKYGGRETELYKHKKHNRNFKLVESILSETAFASYPVKYEEVFSDSSQIYKEHLQPLSLAYYNIMLRLKTKSNLSFGFAVSQFRINNVKNFTYYNIVGLRDSTVNTDYGYYHTYLFPSELHSRHFELKTTQNGYYINALYFPLRGLKIVPAFHLVQIMKNDIIVTTDSTVKTDTAWYNKYDNTWTMFNYYNFGYDFKAVDTTYFDYTVSLAAYKDFKNFNFGVIASKSFFYNKVIKQFGVTATWYPYGNMNLYSMITANRKISTNFSGWVSSFLIGGKLLENLWAEASYSMGDIINYTENNAFGVYNQPYTINQKFGITLYPLIKSHIIISVGMWYNQMQTSLVTFSKASDGIVKSNTDPTVNYFILNGGLKWKF